MDVAPSIADGTSVPRLEVLLAAQSCDALNDATVSDRAATERLLVQLG